MNKTKSGFTFIEILVGLSISSAIFIIATTLVVNIFSSTTKGRQQETLLQTKNDLQAEFGNTIRWADSLSFANGVLAVDNITYSLNSGRIFRDSQAITGEEIMVTSFDVSKYISETEGNVSATGSGLTGQYFNNVNFTALSYTQTDFNVNFNWGEGSPSSLIDNDTFSVRFTGQVEAPIDGEYTFFVAADDGARLWVDGNLIVDNWEVPGFSEGQGRVRLSGGEKYDIRLDYFESAGSAEVALGWSYSGVSRQIVPTARLYPRGGPVSVEVVISMHHRNSILLVDTMKLVLSPRGGNVSTVE